MDPPRPRPPLRFPPELVALHRRRAAELRAQMRSAAIRRLFNFVKRLWRRR